MSALGRLRATLSAGCPCAHNRIPTHLLKIIYQILDYVLASRVFIWEGHGGSWLLKSGRSYVDRKPSTGVTGWVPFRSEARGPFGPPVFILGPESNFYGLLLSVDFSDGSFGSDAEFI